MRAWPTIVACTILAACSNGDEGPEVELRAWVAAMEQAAEDKNRSAMLDRISERYGDARGNTRKDIGDRLLVYFLRQQDIAIVSKINEITVSAGTAARISLTAGLAGNEAEGFGLSAEVYRFDLELEKSANDWVLTGARWGELGQNLD